jgi:hypothetical protein
MARPPQQQRPTGDGEFFDARQKSARFDLPNAKM